MRTPNIVYLEAPVINIFDSFIKTLNLLLSIEMIDFDSLCTDFGIDVMKLSKNYL